MYLIALADKNWAIGNKGEQIIYIPDDLRHFKSLTEGKAVILGRKTFYTFPNKKPLKNRRNLILSRNKDFKPEGAEIFDNIEALVKNAPSDAFVIGGESVYRELLKYCGRAYITMVEHEFEADKFLPNLDIEPGWRLLKESDEMRYQSFTYTFKVYERV